MSSSLVESALWEESAGFHQKPYGSPHREITEASVEGFVANAEIHQRHQLTDCIFGLSCCNHSVRPLRQGHHALTEHLQFARHCAYNLRGREFCFHGGVCDNGDTRLCQMLTKDRLIHSQRKPERARESVLAATVLKKHTSNRLWSHWLPNRKSCTALA